LSTTCGISKTPRRVSSIVRDTVFFQVAHQLFWSIRQLTARQVGEGGLQRPLFAFVAFLEAEHEASGRERERERGVERERMTKGMNGMCSGSDQLAVIGR
jgi:hypothetical protein